MKTTNVHILIQVVGLLAGLGTIASAFVPKTAFDEYKQGVFQVLQGIRDDGKETKEAVKELNRKVDRLLAEQRRER